MSDEPAHDGADAVHGSGGHGEHPHLPPPSFIPISAAFSLGVIFVGFLGDIRSTVGPTMWVIGLVGLVVSVAAWVRAARREYLELPEDASH